MRILIKSTEVATKEGTSAKTKNHYKIRTQTGWIMLDGETRKIPITLEEDQAAFPIGAYDLGDGSYYVGDFGRLMIGRIDLIPVASAGKVTSAA